MTGPTTAVRTGGCQCGNIRYEASGVPDDPHLCSCEHCTLMSGSPAMLWVGFELEKFTWSGPGGEPAWYATWPTLRRGFCPRCGTPVCSVAEDSPMIMVTGFSLTDQSDVNPVGTASAASRCRG
ncbi:GFA family protein [Streptomyces sp. IBSNAI002]|uniref:GFA family protein n=1 Tax=Streptomyces sp. IBSNAI002 TaxID=3457500 RepID=UPI003FD4B1C7